MENAHRIENTAGAPGTGTSIVPPGFFPIKSATVTAEVLARMLAGEKMTGLNMVLDASTTRLAAVVHRLQRDYGWEIEREDRAVGCRDGRVAYVTAYWMSNDTRRRAMAAGGTTWCSGVRHARAALRTKAAEARRAADRTNAALAASKRRQFPGQAGLFDGEAVTP